jgi:hypothetical protein
VGQISPKKKQNKSRYLFKITVVGPEDGLLEQVMHVFSEKVVAVDGVRITSEELETDTTDVQVVFMSPRHSALDLLLSMTYSGANGAMIVMREADPEIETVYRNEIRENIGAGIPTRTIFIGQDFDEFDRNEIIAVFDDIIDEILDAARVSRK